MSAMWKVIDEEVFQWSKCIMMDDGAVARCHEIGVNLANAKHAGKNTSICRAARSVFHLVLDQMSGTILFTQLGLLNFSGRVARHDIEENLTWPLVARQLTAEGGNFFK